MADRDDVPQEKSRDSQKMLFFFFFPVVWKNLWREKVGLIDKALA